MFGLTDRKFSLAYLSMAEANYSVVILEHYCFIQVPTPMLEKETGCASGPCPLQYGTEKLYCSGWSKLQKPKLLSPPKQLLSMINLVLVLV